MRMLNSNMAASRSTKLLLFALFTTTRLCFIVLQILVNNLIPDHHADAFHQSPLPNPTTGDKLVSFLLDGFTKWDAAYFLHLAEEGYTDQHMFAFFSLFPMLVRILGFTVLYPLQYLMAVRSVLIVSSVLVNLCASPVCALMLFKVGCYVLGDGQMVYRAALFFCINPASVFMSTAYTETMFAMLSFAGMLKLEQGHYMSSAALFALSGATRSNGLTSLGFILYGFVKAIVMRFTTVVRTRSRTAMASFYGVFLYRTAVVILSTGIMILPFIIFQFAYMAICVDYKLMPTFIKQYLQVGTIKQTLALDRSWCGSTLPIPYSMIQSKHWKVGFLQYYQIKQIPNFFLALPMVLLCMCAVIDYCSTRWRYVKLLGLTSSVEMCKYDKTYREPTHWFYDDCMFVYIVHMLVLTLFGVTCMHVQVVTRFLASSCPVIYWYVAWVTSDPSKQPMQPPTVDEGEEEDQASGAKPSKFDQIVEVVLYNALTMQVRNWQNLSETTKIVYRYFFLYNVLGLVLHCNFLPWT